MFVKDTASHPPIFAICIWIHRCGTPGCRGLSCLLAFPCASVSPGYSLEEDKSSPLTALMRGLSGARSIRICSRRAVLGASQRGGVSTEPRSSAEQDEQKVLCLPARKSAKPRDRILAPVTEVAVAVCRPDHMPQLVPVRSPATKSENTHVTCFGSPQTQLIKCLSFFCLSVLPPRSPVFQMFYSGHRFLVFSENKKNSKCLF